MRNIARAIMRSLPAPLALLALGVWLRAVGSGVVRSEARTVRDFEEVALSGSGRLEIRQTGEESLEIEAEDNILPLLTSEVSGRRLTLAMKPNTSITTTRPIVYRLTVKDLAALGISGSGDASATGLATPALRVSVSGSGSVALAGRAERQEVTISGSGSFRAGDLAGREASVRVSGSGNALVAASERLEAIVSGSGSVTYSGDPQVTRRITGSGGVRRR